jgi:imidazolonepropionase-like amidohydrolase
MTSSHARVHPTYAIVNCKIFPVSSSAIEKGVIVIRDGLIESVGPSEEIDVPQDAQVIEAEGMCAYPGLIDAHTYFLLEKKKEEPPEERAVMRMRRPSREVEHRPQDQVFGSLKPKKTTISSLHKIGITTILVVPEKEIYAGQSVLLNLNGEEACPMVVKNPFALHLYFTTKSGAYPSSLMGTMALLRQSFLDAQHYSLHKSVFSRSSKGTKRPEYDPFLEALLPFVIEKKPVVFHCENLEDIKRALRLIEEFKLNGYLTGANEAWRVADLLKKAKVPVIVALDFDPPITSIYANKGKEAKEKAEKEIYPANAAELHKAGVRFALCSDGIKKTADITKNIRRAIEKGLPEAEALEAMTLTPAKFLGVADVLGSIEPGKIANIVLTSGEIFQEKSKVKKVFVDGLCFEIKEPPKGAKPPAVNIAGKWSATISGPMGEMEMTLEIEQEGNTISGKIVSNFGQWDISDGILSGNDLTFVVAANIMGESVELSFSGKAEKDFIEGTFSFTGGSAELEATRIPGMITEKGGL